MENLETNPDPNLRPELEDNEVEEALLRAGLSDVRAPHPDTVAYRNLIEAAQRFMAEVKMTSKLKPYQSGDAEDYFREKRRADKPSDSLRREYHTRLSMLLISKTREQLSAQEVNQISNFAAYLTGDEDYIDTW